MPGEDDIQPLMDPDEYARLVGEASDQDLQAGLDQNGELIIDQVFQAMPTRLRSANTAGVSIVAHWRIRDVGQSGEVRWQVSISDQQCTVERDGQLPADVTFAVRGIDFIKLITGNAHGPRMFLLGRLKIRGDLLKAGRFQSYFQAPRAG
jgi:alkyl sulfatase BDS1-like metallo-beta-lactamase superfamily hydrolase